MTKSVDRVGESPVTSVRANPRPGYFLLRSLFFGVELTLVIRAQPHSSLRVAAYLISAFSMLVVFLLGCGREPVERAQKEEPAAGKPNIVLVMTDDQDVRSTEHMPHLQALLEERGTTFQNAFVTNALCCPSRVTILTGEYSHNHGVVTNEWPGGGFRKFRESGVEGSTVATRLQSAGYTTAYFGKYLNGYNSRYVPPGWDEWRAVAGNYRSNFLSENGEIRRYDPEKTHDTDVLTAKALRFVDDASKREAPFFAVVAPRAPHHPAIPAPRHRGEFEDEALPRPPAFDEEDVSEKPAWIRDRPRLSRPTIEYLEGLHQKRLESLQSVDEIFPRLVETLRENGKLHETYVIFTSDNGYHMGHHRLAAGKWTAYEESIRVPLIVRGPEVPEGEEVEEMVLNNDFAPTFADLAGIEDLTSADGSSLVPLLEETPPENWRTAFLVEESRKAVSRRPALAAVRTTSSMYVEYASGEREFYDLQRDPHQLENRYRKADPDLLRRLQNRLQDLRSCEGESCRAAEGF